jgi:hypothetical protein
MKIMVKRKHIRNGQRHCAGACPIALACWEAGLTTYVAPDYVALYDRDCGRRELHLTSRARAFVKAFDAGRPVKPFAFQLPVECAQ